MTKIFAPTALLGGLNYYRTSRTDNVTLSTSWTTINSLSLPAGTYLVAGSATFFRLSSGITNTFSLSIRGGDSAPGVSVQQSAEGGYPGGTAVGITTLTTATTITLSAQYGDASSGYTARTNGVHNLYAVRIA